MRTISRYRIRNDFTDRESVESFGNRLASEFDTERVIASVFDRVIDTECAVPIVLDIDIHVTEEKKNAKSSSD